MIHQINSEDIEKINKEINYKISNNPFEKSFVYELNNQIIGFINFSEIYNRLELNYIWIEKNYRGKNYSEDLMNFMIDYSKKKNIENITLEVSTNNPIALHLYKKYSFIEVARRQQYYKESDAILMIRKFDKYE